MPLGVGRGQNVGLRDFCQIWTLLPPGASVFHKHMSSFLHFNFAYYTNKAPYNKSSLQARIRWLWHLWLAKNFQRCKGKTDKILWVHVITILSLYDGQSNIIQTVQCNLIKLGTHVALVKLMCRQNGELHVWTCHPYGIMEYIPLYLGRCQFKSDWGIHLYMYNLYCLHVNYYHLRQTCKIQHDCVLIRWRTSHVHHFKSA